MTMRHRFHKYGNCECRTAKMQGEYAISVSGCLVGSTVFHSNLGIDIELNSTLFSRSLCDRSGGKLQMKRRARLKTSQRSVSFRTSVPLRYGGGGLFLK